MNKNYAIIIEARSGSKRLKRKILKKINDKTILEILINRLVIFFPKNKIIIATTSKKTDDIITKIAIKNSINFFRGSENNLIRRIYLCADKFNVNNIIQLTSDNPLVDINTIKKLYKIYLKKNYEFATNSHIRTFPKGMDVRIFNKNILKETEKLVPAKKREHTTYYFLTNFNKIKSYNLIANKKYDRPDLRLTLDYNADFLLLKKILNNFKKKKYFNLQKIINFLDTHPKIKKINSKYDKHYKL
jgi:spore coat polysaccharide biosynthesis protein SpsF